MANTLKYTDGTGPAFVDGTTGKAATFDVQAQTADRVYAVPDASGTLLIDTDLSAYAPLASPTFTGTPAAPNPSDADDSTQVATTHFVFTGGVYSAPVIVAATTGGSTVMGVNIATSQNFLFISAGTMAAYTLTADDGTYDGQVVFITFNNIVTALTMDGANWGASGLDVPTAATVGQCFGWVWNATEWVRFQ